MSSSLFNNVYRWLLQNELCSENRHTHYVYKCTNAAFNIKVFIIVSFVSTLATVTLWNNIPNSPVL